MVLKPPCRHDQAKFVSFTVAGLSSASLDCDAGLIGIRPPEALSHCYTNSISIPYQLKLKASVLIEECQFCENWRNARKLF